MRIWGVVAILGICAVGVVALTLGRTIEQPKPRQEGPVLFMGLHGRTTEAFFLDGGSYRGVWSAWGETPAEPPCTHSVELIAVDPNMVDGAYALAESIDVPATGVSAEVDLQNVAPGDYYVQVTSACAWQVQLVHTIGR